MPSRFRKENLSEGANGFFRFVGNSAEHGGAAKRSREKFSERGAILIEFAVAMPVLIILTMYIHDLALMKRYYDQMEFVNLQMANILQNVSQKRTDKKITLNDIKYARAAANLCMFPGITQFATAERVNPFGYGPLGIVFAVKGISDSTASVLWYVRYHTVIIGYSPQKTSVAVNDANDIDASEHLVQLLTNVSPEQIYPKLKIKKGEIKIILESNLYYRHDGGSLKFSDGRSCSKVSPREAFGFFLLSPHELNNFRTYFSSVLIFSPKPELFSGTPPQ